MPIRNRVSEYFLSQSCNSAFPSVINDMPFKCAMLTRKSGFPEFLWKHRTFFGSFSKYQSILVWFVLI